MVEEKPFRLYLATPYLFESDPYFREKRMLRGPHSKKLITIDTIKDSFPGRGALKPDLAIAGCTEAGEALVESMRDSGIVVARYSIFYGQPSWYTGKKPEESGYSLDIPKDPKLVHGLLEDDSFLESVVQRDESAIRKSLLDISSIRGEKVLPTSFLSKALKI